jgi:hypothetical protein
VTWDLALDLVITLVILPIVWDHYLPLLLIPWPIALTAIKKGRLALTMILLATLLITIQRYWKPLAAFHFPIWLSSFGLAAVLVTFAYLVYLAGTGRANSV